MNTKKIIINLLILMVFLIGLALIPFTALGYYEKLNWKLFASTYVIDPQVTSNYYTGDIGSEFEITGQGFPPFSGVYIRINETGNWLRITHADEFGNFFEIISANYLTIYDYGLYEACFSTGDFFNTVSLIISPTAPQRFTDSTIFPYYLRSGYAWPIPTLYLPMITR